METKTQPSQPQPQLKVKDLFDSETKWRKHYAATDEYGLYTEPESPSAKCFCLVGAIYKCYGRSSSETAQVLKKVRKEIGLDNIPYWNDKSKRTFAEVKALVEKLDI